MFEKSHGTMDKERGKKSNERRLGNTHKHASKLGSLNHFSDLLSQAHKPPLSFLDSIKWGLSLIESRHVLEASSISAIRMSLFNMITSKEFLSWFSNFPKPVKFCISIRKWITSMRLIESFRHKRQISSFVPFSTIIAFHFQFICNSWSVFLWIKNLEGKLLVCRSSITC